MKTKFIPKIVEHVCISRVTNLLNGINRPNVCLKKSNRTYYVSTPQQLPSGDIVYVTKETVLDTSSKLSKFRVYDFSINSLRLSGAINSLKPIKLSGDRFHNIENMESALDTISRNISDPNPTPNPTPDPNPNV